MSKFLDNTGLKEAFVKIKEYITSKLEGKQDALSAASPLEITTDTETGTTTISSKLNLINGEGTDSLVQVVTEENSANSATAQSAFAAGIGSKAFNTGAIAWGKNNTAGDEIAQNYYSVAIGGIGNTSAGSSSAIIGGTGNNIHTTVTYGSTILGGQSNNIYSSDSVIISGYANSIEQNNNGIIAASTYAQMVGTAYRGCNAILASYSGKIDGATCSAIIGGYDIGSTVNIIYGNFSVILGGGSNTINSESSVILGGENNTTNNLYEVASGQKNLSITSADDTTHGGTLFTVGYPVTDEESTVHNANNFEIHQDGEIYIKGIGSFNGYNYDEDDTQSLQEVIANLGTSTLPLVPVQGTSGSTTAYSIKMVSSLTEEDTFGNSISSTTVGGTVLGLKNSITSGNYAVCFGVRNDIQGNQGFTVGQDNKCHGENAVCMGGSNGVYQKMSTAFGGSNSISGQYSVAGGQSNTVNSNACVALGWSNNIPKNCEGAVTLGMGNHIYNEQEVAVGSFSVSVANTDDISGTKFIVGNGTSSNDKLNVIDVRKDNNVYIKGIGNYDGDGDISSATSLQDVISALSSKITALNWYATAKVVDTDEFEADAHIIMLGRSAGSTVTAHSIPEGCTCVIIRGNENTSSSLGLSYSFDVSEGAYPGHGYGMIVTLTNIGGTIYEGLV